MKTKITLAAIVLLACCCFPYLSFSQAGSLDLTFNSTGIVTTAAGTSYDLAQGVAIQTDGKIVVAGNRQLGFSTDFAVLRYNGNGSLDNTFGTGGIATTDFAHYDDLARAVAIQTDGKIIAAGYCTTDSGLSYCLARYQINGNLDSAFGTNGKVTMRIGTYNSYGTSVTIQTDGKIVMAGYTEINAFNYTDFATVRYNSDGSLDNTFGTGGIVITDFGSIFDYGFSVALQTNGKIIVAGESRTNPGDIDIALVRYNTDGTPDSTFDTDGKLTTDYAGKNESAASVAVQPDGKIVAAGFTNGNTLAYLFAVTRYNNDSTLDTTFDSDGRVSTDFPDHFGGGTAMVLQSDGKIVVAGTDGFSSAQDIALLRYNSNGSIDSTFDNDGMVTTAIGSGDDVGNAVALQTDGKIVVAGNTNNGSNTDIAVVRYNNDGTVSGIADAPASLNTTNVYPNPFSAQLMIKGTKESGEIFLLDVTGKEIFRQKTVDETTTINTEKLIAGYYLLNYVEQNKSTAIKLIKF